MTETIIFKIDEKVLSFLQGSKEITINRNGKITHTKTNKSSLFGKQKKINTIGFECNTEYHIIKTELKYECLGKISN
jgi:hypothetical protein